MSAVCTLARNPRHSRVLARRGGMMGTGEAASMLVWTRRSVTAQSRVTTPVRGRMMPALLERAGEGLMLDHLGQVLPEAARRFGDKTAIVCDGRAFTFREINAL